VVEFVVPIDVCLGGLREAIKYLIRTDAWTQDLRNTKRVLTTPRQCSVMELFRSLQVFIDFCAFCFWHDL
jgi:hypothetical protein